jgi:hypothetical protein
MTQPLGAINARTHPVTDYDPDPRNPGAQLLHDVWLRLHGWLVPAVVGGDTDPELQFHGYGPQMQDFVGLANPSANSSVTRNGEYADVSSAVTAGPMGDPVRRIFADRLRRRQTVGT